MVKGVSRQVIVVRPQDGKLYEQAIFILKEDAQDVTDDMLLREAVQLAARPKKKWARAQTVLVGKWLINSRPRVQLQPCAILQYRLDVQGS